MHVLIAEDHRACAAAISALLRTMGHEVDWLGSGNELANLLALATSADLLMLDLDLGDADGADIVSRARDAGHHVPSIILFSARSRRFLAAAASRIDACAILTKPFTLDQLTDALQRLAESVPRSG